MFSRLAQGVNSVLQELSGEEPPDAPPEEGLIPQPPPDGDETETEAAPLDAGAGDGAVDGETLERLAQTEQLVVQLKELIREKDNQLASAERRFKEEKETGDARFTKLKLQAKAKMAALNKQINELKGQEGLNVSQSSEGSFSAGPGVEEELQQLRAKLQEGETASRTLQEKLEASEQLLNEKEQGHAEQVRRLQAVIVEKDVRFQEQIQKHEEELLRVSAQAPADTELQQALRSAQRRVEELEESLHSRQQVLEMLQQELNSADQQKQILTAQFRQMEQQLTDMGRQREQEQQQWLQQAAQTQADLGALRASLEASERQREEAVARLESESQTQAELTALRASLETSERQREEAVARLESEAQQWAAETKELKEKLAASTATEREQSDSLAAELSVLRAGLEVALREREEAMRTMEAHSEARDAELSELRDRLAVAEREKEEGAKREGQEVQKLEMELAALRKSLEAGAGEETQDEGARLKETLGELWRRLHTLTAGPAEALKEEKDEEEKEKEEVEEMVVPAAIPNDPAECLAALQALEAMMQRLRAEREEGEAQLAQVTVSMASLRGQLDKNTTEREEAIARIQELEKQINSNQVTGESAGDHMTDPSQEDLMSVDTEGRGDVTSLQANILALEQQLQEKEHELVFLKEQLAISSQQETKCQEPGSDQSYGGISLMQDASTAMPDLLDTTVEEETTLVADESSIMYTSADNESSPELLQPQPESPGESKGASSDEMVTSSDSEVAHSSWTLLEAVNQDGGQEWPSVMQDLSQLHLQAWEETAEQDRSTSSVVQVESSSVVIRETIQVNVGQQMASLVDLEAGPGQALAQVLAEELQKKYSELLAELERLRASASESEVKAQGLEERLQSISVSKEEAETKAVAYEEELKAIRAEMETLAQQRDAVKVLEEQLASLQSDSQTKEHKILSLQADLDQVQQSLAEQEGQARMLSAQLEERELCVTEAEQRLRNAEAKLLEITQAEELAETSLCEKTAEIEELHLRLSEKEQEMMELNDSMSAKLQQAGEETFQASSEVKKLQQHILEMESMSGEQRKAEGEDISAHDGEELAGLRKEKEDLVQQMATMKKEGDLTKRKLQAALVQRKELMKKVAAFEAQAVKSSEQAEVVEQKTSASPTHEVREKEEEIRRLGALLDEARETLRGKQDALDKLEHQISDQEKTLTEARAENERLTEEVNLMSQSKGQALHDEEEKESLTTKVGALESELERLQKKLQDAEESRKDTIRKAKEKDRHHRDQLKQQRDDHSMLLERFEAQSGQLDELLNRLKELEELQMLRVDVEAAQSRDPDKPFEEKPEKSESGGWVQEDWVDFAAPEAEPQQKEAEDQQTAPTPIPVATSSEDEATLRALREEVEVEKAARAELEGCLNETQNSLSLRDAEILELGKELQTLKEKDKQIDLLSSELEALREKCVQAEAHADMLKKEVEEVTAAAKASLSDSASPIALLQAEVEEFKQFLNDKNDEIVNLSQQLSEQNTLLQKMQETVSEKDQRIKSLQESLEAEQEKSQRLEAEVPLKQEEEKDSNAKLQQMQRKLQAALISRKEALRENSTLKEEQAAAEKTVVELQKKLEDGEAELSKMRTERERLIAEVDRSLVENQSLGASCESLKLAMESLLSEKEACRQQAELAKEEAEKASHEWEEKVQGMKDEYETLLKSYENVSDEAERVRRVLEAARQERQELAAKARAHESARKEAEKLAEEAQKEVDAVKDKMRKFAKTKQQKIMELEEENERLREQEERVGIRRDDREVRQELQRVKQELETLRAELDSTKSQRNVLEQLAVELKQQLSEEKERVISEAVSSSTSVVVEEVVVAQESSVVQTEMTQDVDDSPPQFTTDTEEQKEPPVKMDQSEVSVPESVESPELVESVEERPKNEDVECSQDQTQERMRELEASLQTAQTSVKELEAALEAEKQSRAEQEAEIKSQLTSLEQQLEEAKGKEDVLKEEISKRENQLKELRTTLEAEKDDLEERLMNQLAQLNGSIAGYQQEAADSRDRLADLQRDVERLEHERAELEVVVETEKDRACRLEEDKRQAQRERAEAEAEAGKQRELEQKLKSAQRVKEGSQSRAKQLEELLREKQLEVRQMQKDCIQYQERISSLGKETKALLLNKDELKAEVEASDQKASKVLEEKTKTEQELSECKEKLEETQKAASQAQEEAAALKENALKREAEIRAEAEETLDEVRYRLGAEMKHIELRLEDSFRERERDEDVIREVRHAAEVARKDAQDMQARLDESLARLAAFSRSMSSLQDDRDRVLDEARQWENRFHSALQGKEAEVQQAEKKALDLSEQLQKETTQKEELQASLERLQKAEAEWQARWDEVEKKHGESMAALEKERGELKESLAEAESSLAQTSSQLSSMQTEAEGQRHRTSALEEAVGKLQGELNEARAELREREAEERRLGLSLEQLETDLRSSKNLTESLQAELSEKEKREVELLGEKEQAVTSAVEEARKEADLRAETAEKELEERREEVRGLKEKLQKAEEDSKQSKARLEAFTKAMGSLQDDRDRVLSQYKQLEERHLQVMMEKDGLIQEAASENNGLKEEIRVLLVQRDDLHAEKAKLAAQLHNYREELNQVLSMKESQHRQLLAAQREQMAALEREKQQLEAVVRDLGSRQRLLPPGEEQKEEVVVQEERVVAVEREVLSQASGDARPTGATRDAPGAEVEKLREQLEAARARAEELEEALETEREAQVADSKELKELRWEGGVLRTEAETAEERVAELARDLVVLEQKLLEEREAAAKLRAENESFGRSMSSLQDARDAAIGEAKELRRKVEEMAKAGQKSPPASSSGGSTGEVWSLKNALSALQNERERLLEHFHKQEAELALLRSGDLAKVIQELAEERKKAAERVERMGKEMKEKDAHHETARRELEVLRLERVDWQAQAELLKQQTLATLSDRDQQLRQLTAMLEEARAQQPKITQEQFQREENLADSAPGAPQEKSENYRAEMLELQRRLDEEMEQRTVVEEQLMAAQDRLKRYAQAEWQSTPESRFSETAVLIEPPEGAISRGRSGGPGLVRMLRAGFCSRQRTPLLVSLYLLTVHVLLLMCLGGYL